MEMINDLGYFKKQGTKHKHTYAVYCCPFCKTEFTARKSHVNSGATRSCGCLMRNSPTKTHGMSKTNIYGVWLGMKRRCGCLVGKDCKNYHNRGIVVCPQWREDFVSFYDWAVVNGYEKGLEIDRINNDGNYEPSNCRFVTKLINSNNKRLMRDNNKSGYNGICYHKQSGRWQARVTYCNKVYYIGKYNDIINAVKKRNEFIITHGFPHKLTVIS